MSKLSKSELENHAFRKLSHLMVGANEKEVIQNAHNFIVEQALLESHSPASLNEIRIKISEVFSLRFSNEEIKNALGKLVGKNVKETNSKYFLSIERTTELQKNNQETKNKEKEIYQDWINEIGKRYPELNEEEKRLLSQDLRFYINQLFLKNGAECSTFVYPNNNGNSKDTGPFSTSNIFSLLPERTAKLETIRKIEFPLFLKDANLGKRTYFSSLLDGTFIYNIIQVDNDTLQALKASLKNYVFYLDTNILYGLFNLNVKDTKSENVIDKTFNISTKTFGIKFVVSSRTLEEMRKSIQSKSNRLLSSPDIRRDLGETAADISEEENFITAYWRAFYQTGITKKDFIAKYLHISDLVKSKGILVDDTEFNPKQSDVDSEKKLLNSTIPSRKGEEVANHDAYHRLLIEDLRIKSRDKKYWFLTFDSQVAYYGVKTKKESELPFAFLPHQLLQILRLFEKRTNNYDATFLELFAKPQIKSAKDVIPNDYAEKILSKISGYADIPKELAIKILVDSKFVESIFKDSSEPDQDQKIKERIELEVASRLREVTDRLNSLEEEKRNSTNLVLPGFDSRDKVITKQKTVILSLALVIFIIVVLVLALKYWNDLNLAWRIASSSFSVTLLISIFRIKFKFSKIFEVIGVLGAIVPLIFSLSNKDIPNQDKEMPSEIGTSTPIQ